MYYFLKAFLEKGATKYESMWDSELEAFQGFIDKNDDSRIHKSEVFQRDMKGVITKASAMGVSGEIWFWLASDSTRLSNASTLYIRQKLKLTWLDGTTAKSISRTTVTFSNCANFRAAVVLHYRVGRKMKRSVRWKCVAKDVLAISLYSLTGSEHRASVTFRYLAFCASLPPKPRDAIRATYSPPELPCDV